MKNRFKSCLKLLVLTAFFGLLFTTSGISKDRATVMVSILPQKYFIHKIAGDRVHVEVMVLPGANPATYEPKPRQMVLLDKASMYFAIGVPFEAVWLNRFANANPEMTIVHTEQGIEKIPLKGKHSHEGDTEQHHEGTKDPHIWLSPSLVMIQASNILQALIANDPSYEDRYRDNYKAFISELEILDKRIKAVFSNRPEGAPFMVYHPSWGYFAEAFGLEQIPIELEGKEPSPKELADLIHYAQGHRIKAVIVQPQFSMKSAQTIAKAIGAQVVVADPLADDWADNLFKVAVLLEQSSR